MATGWRDLRYSKGSTWESSGGSPEIEGSNEESEEGSETVSAVAAMEAMSSILTTACVSFDDPWVVVGAAGGAAVESAVSAMGMAVSVIDARTLESSLMGVRFE